MTCGAHLASHVFPVHPVGCYISVAQSLSLSASAPCDAAALDSCSLIPQQGEQCACLQVCRLYEKSVMSGVCRVPFVVQQGQISTSTSTSTTVKVSPQEVTGAMRDMLAAAGMSLSLDRAQMLEEALALRERLAAAESKAEAARQVCNNLHCLFFAPQISLDWLRSTPTKYGAFKFLSHGLLKYGGHQEGSITTPG